MRLVLFQACLYQYMNYQSFLSAILQNKYYTQQEISQLSLTIQRNSGLKILSTKLSETQIFLYCPNRQQTGCSFSHLFNPIDSSKASRKFQLFCSNEKHSIECQDLRNGKVSQQKLNFQQNQAKSSILTQSTDLGSQIETCAGSPVSKQSIMNITKINLSTSQNIQKKLYTEEQFSLLKKELELESKGFLSKSTEFQPQPNNNVIKRIQFHCKFQNSCPYKAFLNFQTVQQQKKSCQSKKQFSLEIVHSNHLPQCVLDEEVINYNENTMKIDKEIELLTEIVRQNSQQLKPKDILKKLADQLGQEEEFIYSGLQKKINKRAIKKYFDNCVAKVRSKIFPQIKSPKIQSPTRHRPITKKDEDYSCK